MVVSVQRLMLILGPQMITDFDESMQKLLPYRISFQKNLRCFLSIMISPSKKVSAQ